MKEFITVKELSQLTGYKPQTVYNKINCGDFILGQHFLKPTKKKILFKRDALQEWLGLNVEMQESVSADKPKPESTVSKINI